MSDLQKDVELVRFAMRFETFEFREAFERIAAALNAQLPVRAVEYGSREHADKLSAEIAELRETLEKANDAYAQGVTAGRSEALNAQAEPVGEWAMVPREPTDRMLGAGINAAVCRAGKASWCPEVWAAMLAAAPQPQARPQASAEDLRAIDVIGKGDMASQAWKRIRADYERMGVK